MPSQDRSAVISVIYTAPVAFLSTRNLSEITAGSSSPSSSPSHHYQPSSPNNIPAGRGLLKLLSAKNIKSGSGSGQSSVFTVQPPEIWGRPDRIIIFIRVVFVDSNHPAIQNYPVVLFNKQKVHSSHLIGMNGLRQF